MPDATTPPADTRPPTDTIPHEPGDSPLENLRRRCLEYLLDAGTPHVLAAGKVLFGNDDFDVVEIETEM